MNPLANIAVGMTATKETVVTPELTVGHFVKGMPLVYGTPMMIFLMETASGAAIADHLPAGWVSVGTEVNIEQSGLPAVIPLEACYLGWQQSLRQLAELVEPEIRD